MSEVSSDDDLRPPPNLTHLSVTDYGRGRTTPLVTPKPKKPDVANTLFASLRKRIERVGMTPVNPGQASGLQARGSDRDDAGGDENQPQVPSGDTQGTEIIGASPVPPQVLAVTPEEDLPVWFKPLWEHLSIGLQQRPPVLEDLESDIRGLKRLQYKFKQNLTRVEGVEE